MTATARSLWRLHFQPVPSYFRRDHEMPTVYWSSAMRVADARCYPWGIVLSWSRYRRVPKARRRRWLVGLLLHELLHVAGYGHDATFRAHAKALGTW